MDLSNIQQHCIHGPVGEGFQIELEEMVISLPENLVKAHPNRQQQFLLGRYCAHKALFKSGLVGECSIPIGNDGAPVWPQGFCGSITHCEGYVKAVTSLCKYYISLGVDSQTVMNEKTYNNIVSKILTPNEQNIKINGYSNYELATLIFSSKESIYKCLRPISQRFFGFQAAEITSIDTDSSLMNYILLEDIGGGLNQGHYGTLKFEKTQNIIHTLTWLRAD